MTSPDNVQVLGIDGAIRSTVRRTALERTGPSQFNVAGANTVSITAVGAESTVGADGESAWYVSQQEVGISLAPSLVDAWHGGYI